MQIHVITTPQEMLPLRDPWNALAGGNPFLSWEWIEAWWHGYGGGHQLAIVTVVDDSQELIGIVPLYRSSGLYGGTLRFVGSYYTASDYLRILAKPEDRHAVQERFLSYLSQAINHSSSHEAFGRIELDGIEMNDLFMRDLSDQLLSAGYGVRKEIIENTWRIDLPATWQEFRDSLGYGCRRKARKAEKRIDAGECVVKTTQSAADLDRLAPMFADLHQRRRRQLGQEGCFSDPRFGTFFRHVARSLSATGRARLQWIERHGKPIAAQFQLLSDSEVYVFQSGMDPDACHFEPGHVMTAAAIRHAIEQGYRAFDLLRGDEPYKAYWSARPQSLCRYLFTAPLLRAKLVDAVCQGLTQAKRLAKSVLALPGDEGLPIGAMMSAKNTAP